MNALLHLHSLMVVVSLTAVLWWALSRQRRPAVLEALSAAAFLLAGVTLAVEGVRWQLVPWFGIAIAVMAAAALRRGGAGHSRRGRRGRGRGAFTHWLLVRRAGAVPCALPPVPQPSRPPPV